MDILLLIGFEGCKDNIFYILDIVGKKYSFITLFIKNKIKIIILSTNDWMLIIYENLYEKVQELKLLIFEFYFWFAVNKESWFQKF